MEVMSHAHYIDVQEQWKEIQRFNLNKPKDVQAIQEILKDTLDIVLEHPYIIFQIPWTMQQ